MALLAFQQPEKITATKTDDFNGIFEFHPLEPGFGVTVGNSLRRVLLSSLEGYAITAVKIEGVSHEFSTVEGVIQDVTEIVLNLKQVRLKKTIEDPDLAQEKILITINKEDDSFTAGHINKFTTSFEVTNPDLVIFNLDSDRKIDIELTIEKGRGYVPAEENMPEEMEHGLIPIDSIYTPIKNVRYNIENYRVGQRTDYEQLLIEIATDGTIHPEEAIQEAAKILIQHLMLITNEDITFEAKLSKEEEPVDEDMLRMRQLLKTPLEDLELSVRAYNCLKAAKINTLAELVQYDTPQLIKFRNFGRKSLMEIEEMIAKKDLSFGIDISKYKLNED